MSKIIKIGIFILILFSCSFLFNLLLRGEAQAAYWSCNNGPSKYDSGGCGTPCQNGYPWKKYYCCGPYQSSCWYKVGSYWYRRWSRWYFLCGSCSTADKCISGEKGLRYGDCDCGAYQSWKYHSV